MTREKKTELRRITSQNALCAATAPEPIERVVYNKANLPENIREVLKLEGDFFSLPLSPMDTILYHEETRNAVPDRR